MTKVFYEVRQTVNGRNGTYPTCCSTLEEACDFVDKLKRYIDNDIGGMDVQYRIYEVKELQCVDCNPTAGSR